MTCRQSPVCLLCSHLSHFFPAAFLSWEPKVAKMHFRRRPINHSQTRAVALNVRGPTCPPKIFFPGPKCQRNWLVAGRHGLVVRTLGSGDRVRGFKSRKDIDQWQSAKLWRQSLWVWIPTLAKCLFCWLFLLLLPPLFLSLPTVCALLLTMLVGLCFNVFYDSSQGSQKGRNHRKILAVPFERLTSI